MRPRIITAPLWDEYRPHLIFGTNWIAWYDEPHPNGLMDTGGGNTEAQAVADLIEHHPRGYPDCARTVERAARIKRLFAALHADTMAQLQAAE